MYVVSEGPNNMQLVKVAKTMVAHRLRYRYRRKTDLFGKPQGRPVFSSERILADTVMMLALVDFYFLLMAFSQNR